MISRIYGLVDPTTGLIKYVGKCITPLNRRLQNHEYRARSGRDQSRKGVWIRSLHRRGLRPTILLLEETAERWQDAERRWISELRRAGLALFNVHQGGNGAHTRAALDSRFIPMLGVISDGRVAKLAGLCRETITYHRRRAGIPAAVDRSRSRCTFPKGHTPHNKVNVPAHIMALLGEKSDGELARACGVDRGLIKQRRIKAGIPARWLEKGKT